MELNDTPLPEIRRLVALGCKRSEPYISDCLRANGPDHRSKQLGEVVSVWIGHSGAGKDFGAKCFYTAAPGTYGGSCSSAVAPVIAAALDVPLEQAWKERHQNRMFWFNFLNEFRREDPALVARMTFRFGSCIVGVRARREYEALRAIPGVGLTIWVEQEGLPKDPTLELTRADADIVVDNCLTPAFGEKLVRLGNCFRSLKQMGVTCG